MRFHKMLLADFSLEVAKSLYKKLVHANMAQIFRFIRSLIQYLTLKLCELFYIYWHLYIVTAKLFIIPKDHRQSQINFLT